jgi:hypothetical protein
MRSAMRLLEPWGQVAGKARVVHRFALAEQVVAFDSRRRPLGHPQDWSLAKPLMSQAKMAFSTGRDLPYHYHQSEKKT